MFIHQQKSSDWLLSNPSWCAQAVENTTARALLAEGTHKRHLPNLKGLRGCCFNTLLHSVGAKLSALPSRFSCPAAGQGPAGYLNPLLQQAKPRRLVLHRHQRGVSVAWWRHSFKRGSNQILQPFLKQLPTQEQRELLYWDKAERKL